MPRERPGDKFGTSQRHPGRLGRFMWKFIFKGQNVCGTDGTDDGTDGTCPRDRRDTNQGVSRQNFFLFIDLFPHQWAIVTLICSKPQKSWLKNWLPSWSNTFLSVTWPHTPVTIPGTFLLASGPEKEHPNQLRNEMPYVILGGFMGVVKLKKHLSAPSALSRITHLSLSTSNNPLRGGSSTHRTLPYSF